ncbi:MAG TPA: DUF423 domain-containing protein [Flavobacteriaceae bacterium]|jgi:uncharacterized membrane protein YgdD (TMEM256/DUF423 family)|nr:DUF423 domain-containing protein [Flavobacteriaceae bacterium]
MNKSIVITAALLAGTAVLLGAFGAHGLKKIVSPELVNSFETGVRYQMYHALSLLVLGLSTSLPNSVKKWVARLFVMGVFLFSGSIYLLTFKEPLDLEPGLWGLITPIGGVFLIVGWFLLVYKVVNLKHLKVKN